jgi:hypothetical protein
VLKLGDAFCDIVNGAMGVAFDISNAIAMNKDNFKGSDI